MLGFYKGNLCRLSHIYIYGLIRNSITYYANQDPNVMESRSNFFVDLVAATTASLLCHPFHFAESRFVLNNRLPNFGAYKSVFSLMTSTKDPTILTRGMTVYFPTNFIMAFTGFNYFSATNYYTFTI